MDLKGFMGSQRFAIQFLFNKFDPPAIDRGQIYVPNYKGGSDLYRLAQSSTRKQGRRTTLRSSQGYANSFFSLSSSFPCRSRFLKQAIFIITLMLSTAPVQIP